MGTRKRDLTHIEVLRILAIFLVMFNHTSTKGYLLFTVRQSSPFYGIYLFISIACKIAVPIFFMITGALLLGKDESIGTVIRKRLLRFIAVLIGISIVYYIYGWCYNKNFDIKECLSMMYSGTISVPLWYLYSYIGVILMLPFLRKMVKNMEIRDYLYLAVGNVIFVGVLPIVEYLFSQRTVTLSSDVSVPFFTSAGIFYVLMGYCFEKLITEEYYNKRNLVISGVLGIAAIAISAVMTDYRAQIMGVCNGEVSQAFHNRLISIPTFTIYFYAKYFFAKVHIHQKTKNIIQLIGSTTFGIYLLEGILRNLTIQVYYDLEPVFKSLPASFIWIGTAFALGCVITLVLKKIPVIKDFI